MTTIAETLPVSIPHASAPLPRSLYRVSIEKYEAMVRSGVFTKRDRIVLVEGILVAKMTQYPQQAVSSELCRMRFDRILPPGWHLRSERPLRIPSRASMPEPDLVVTRGGIRDFGARHPEPCDVALVIEVADSSLDDDRNLMARVYGGGGVAIYWVVNLVERQIEVYSVPSGPSEPVGYRHCEVYRVDQEVPLVISGTEVGRIPVADLCLDFETTTRLMCDFDVVVLGAGAAGLVAAARAAECGARVLLAEKNRRPGVKILMSGGTRCNITNARGLRQLNVVSGPIDPAFDPALLRGIRAIQQAVGENGAFLAPALRRFDVDATIRMFEDAGVATKVEANGKIFPVSDKAAHVLDALVQRVERFGASLWCSKPIVGLDRFEPGSENGSGFAVRLSAQTITASRVIVAVGGCSYPGCGTIGDGYSIAKQFGHAIVEPRPALVPLRVDADWIPSLRGLSVADAVASVCRGQALLGSRREAVLFTHRGLSGPVILDVSRAATRQSDLEGVVLRLDFLPAISREMLDDRIQRDARRGRRPVVSMLPEELPRRLAECLMTAATISPDRTGPELSRDERLRLIAAIKELAMPIVGSLGFERAEVTSGGVALEEIDPRTLESRLVPGLHFAGEILNLDGLIGGYNFQAAWSTGWLAGESAGVRG